MSETSINQALIDFLTANMAKVMDEKLAELKNERLAILRKKIGSSDHCKPNQDLQEYNRARPRKEQGLTPKPPDHTSRSTWSSPQKIPHSTKSKTVLDSEFLSANELYKFSGKRNYLEWEEHMDDWFYDNHIPREKRLTHAVRQLAGDAYKWWCKEVDDLWYSKKQAITSWRELKKLLRNKYAPQAPNRAAQVNAIIQTVQEKRVTLVSDRNKPTTPREAKPRSYPFEKFAKHVNHEKLEARTTSQPKEVNAQVVVHKQRLKPSLESSNEPKQCESSNLSKSREVTCYNCRKKGHLAVTCPENKELAITSLESTPSSSNSSNEIVNQGLENSSSCVMHLVLSKDIDSGHMMENENDKSEANGELNALEKLPEEIILLLTPKQRTRGTYLESKNRMRPTLLYLDVGQTVLRATLFKNGDYNDARISPNIESMAEVIPQSNRESCLENSFDVGALREAYLIDQRELGNKLNCFRNLTLRSIRRNWNHHNNSSDSRVMNFSNWAHLNVLDLDICALQRAFRPNQKDSRGESSCYRFFSHQVITSNQFEAKISSELEVINFTNQVIQRMPSSRSRKIGSLQAYIWRPGGCSKLSIYAFKDLFINVYTGIMRLSLSNEPNTDFRKAMKRTRKIFKREEDDRFKPSVLDQDKHQYVNYFMLIKEEPPDSNFNPKPNKFLFGIRLLLYEYFACAILFCFADYSNLRNASSKWKSKLNPLFYGPIKITKITYELNLQGNYNESPIFNVTNLVCFLAIGSDLWSNPFQEGEDDMILPSTKNLEYDEKLVAEEKLEAEEQLEDEEPFEPENELVMEEEYGKDVILTSLVLIHDHQMGMCLICTLFPLSSFVPMGFLDKVFNEANDSHSNHPFVDPNNGITFKNWPKGISIKSSLFYAYFKSKKSPNKVSNLLVKRSDENK